jgi:uncharacterized protein (TIGR02145 family)
MKAGFSIYLLIVVSFHCISQTQTYYQLSNGQTITIDEWNECRSVANNTGNSLFIPTKTSAEWLSFINNHPNGITLNACSFNCGVVLVDSRDGQSYNTVQIGTQCWMAQNLNYGEIINNPQLPSNNGLVEKYCFNNNSSNCNNYGAIYLGSEVENEDVCPTGWHVPTDEEVCELTTFLDPTVDCNHYGGLMMGNNIGTQLKVGGSSGFEWQYSGARSCQNTFYSLGSSGGIWTSTLRTNVLIYYWYIHSTKPTQINRTSGDKHCYGTSVRCIKD